MSSVLGERIKQRFGLIGYEKVSRLDPAGRKEGYGGTFLHTQGQIQRALIYLSSASLTQYGYI